MNTAKRLIVSLFGNMVGSCNPLRLVVERLESEGHIAHTFFEDGKPSDLADSQIQKTVRKSDFVLTGMASSKELAALELKAVFFAEQHGVPYGFFADTFGVWAREWFTLYRGDASLVCVLNEEEARDAETYFEHNAVVATGNPSREGDFFPKHTREEVRDMLKIPYDKIVILTPGSKNLYHNVALWGEILGAVQEVDSTMEEYCVLICPHPGELNCHGERFENESAYLEAYGYNRLWDVARCDIRIITKDELPTDDIVPAVDIIIQCHGSVGDTANAQRIPVLEVSPVLMDNALENVTGRRVWTPVEKGVSQKVTGSLSEYMLKVQDPKEIARIAKRQEKVYPKPEELGVSAKAIVRAIESLTL